MQRPAIAAQPCLPLRTVEQHVARGRCGVDRVAGAEDAKNGMIGARSPAPSPQLAAVPIRQGAAVMPIHPKITGCRVCLRAAVNMRISA
jgi:hypothetical protein